jgi:NAD(P)-dependent dehydrogenase (short-subunit alcohol dehydrogenase family)
LEKIFAMGMPQTSKARKALTNPEVVVITGASAGVGRATARAFAKRGAHIGLVARGHEGLKGAQADVEAMGGKALVLPTDMAEHDEVEAAAAAVEEAFGPIDIWINNAMASVFSPILQMTPAEFKRVTDVTFLGYVYGTLAALRRMQPRDRGMIVQVGSALPYRSIPLQSAYCAAKHAVRGFTDSLRCELIHDGSHVRVTMVQMPALNTPQFNWVKSRLPRKPQPVPPIYEPEVAPRRSIGRHITTAVSCMSACRRSRRFSATKLSRGSWTIISVGPAMRRSNTMATTPRTVPTTFGSRCRTITALTATSTSGPAIIAYSCGPIRIAAGSPSPALASPD